jgi:REP element-mobilizing transposase RayT
MITFDPEKHHRRSVRLKGYDYAQGGAYFVTICAAHKRPVFGRLENGAVRLHPYGRIVIEEWERTAILRPHVVLDEFIVMPDHFHAIIVLDNPCRGMACHAQNAAPERNPDNDTIQQGGTDQGMARHAPTFGQPQARALSTIMGTFKSAVTRRINTLRAERGLSSAVVWQRGFHDHIIRDENELNATRRYIIENPLRCSNKTS